MIEILAWLFYLGVFALVVGGLAYLFITREPRDQRNASRSNSGTSAPPSKDLAERAEALSGRYRLSDLERIFEQLGKIEAWGMVFELRFTTVQEEIQMIVNRDQVELCTPYLDPEYTDRFRRAAQDAGLQARDGYTKGQYCVDVTGPWPGRASVIINIIRSIYGVGDNEEVQAHIFT